jgi:SpoVK/Ycf46/Vps4 family AAA+-type ATPase
MLYFFAEDPHYYSKKSLEELKTKYILDEIIAFPNENDIRQAAISEDHKACIAPYLPEQINPAYKRTSFFVVEILKNLHGILTSEQQKYGIEESRVLSEKLQVKTYHPDLTLDDYGGAEKLKEELQMLLFKEKMGLQVKGIGMAGYPGTGKTFFSRCLAGELKRPIIELDIASYMEQENTMYLIDMFFDYFLHQEGEFAILVDEIEKALTGEKAKQVIGKLLGRINDANSSGSAKILLIATANNISRLAKEHPEFFRKGRFDNLIFLKTPTTDGAKSIINLYVRKSREHFRKSLLPRLIYYATTAERFIEDSRALSIINRIKLLYLQPVLSTKKPFISSIDESTLNKNINLIYNQCVDAIDLLEKEFIFDFDTDAFTQKVEETHRGNLADNARFALTPAEIQFAISDAYVMYYFKGQKSFSIEDLAKRYEPLQTILKDAITDLEGAGKSFTEI